MSQLKEAADLSLSQLRELRGWMKEAEKWKAILKEPVYLPMR